MQCLDDSLLPENQQPLVIRVARYGPKWLPGYAPARQHGALGTTLRAAA